MDRGLLRIAWLGDGRCGVVNMTKSEFDAWKKDGSLKVLGQKYCDLCNLEIKGAQWYRQKKTGGCVHEYCLNEIGRKLKKESQK